MREYVTEAIVLGTEPSREYDRVVHLYTKNLGRIRAKAVGGRKLLSKFSPHLQTGNAVAVRLVKKTNFVIADAMTEYRFAPRPGEDRFFQDLAKLFLLLRILLPEGSEERHLWVALLSAVKHHRAHIPLFLRILGYAPDHARCTLCGKSRVRYFYPKEQAFFCARCSGKAPRNALLLTLSYVT